MQLKPLRSRSQELMETLQFRKSCLPRAQIGHGRQMECVRCFREQSSHRKFVKTTVKDHQRPVPIFLVSPVAVSALCVLRDSS